MRMWVRSLVLLCGLRIWCCCKLGVDGRHGSDLVLLWLWCRLAAAALIRPLAWEPPYATCGPKGKKTARQQSPVLSTFHPAFVLVVGSQPGTGQHRGAPSSFLWARLSPRQAGVRTPPPAFFFPRHHISISFIPQKKWPHTLLKAKL